MAAAIAGLVLGTSILAGCTDAPNRSGSGERAVASSPLVEAREALAVQNYDRALAKAQTRLQADSSSLEAWVLKARALSGLGRLDEAYAAVDRAVRLEPRYVEARLVRADLSVRRGSLAVAAEDLNVAASIDARTPAVLRRQAEVQAALGHHRRARQAVTQMLRVRPEDPTGLALDAAIRRARGTPDAGRIALKALRTDRTAVCQTWKAVPDSLPGRSAFHTAATHLHRQHCAERAGQQ